MRQLRIAVMLLGMAMLSGSCSCSTVPARGTHVEGQSGASDGIMEKKDTIYFAGGCFWGTEELMKQVPGVLETETGYANSRVADPTYKEVCSGTTGAAETVEVVYDPNEVSLRHLLDIYLMSVDPTSLNRQGNDRGTQYRTGIFCTSPEQLPVVKKALEHLSREIGRPVVIEAGMLTNFYPAEDYHQDYLEKTPGGYCHISPRLFSIAREMPDPYMEKEGGRDGEYAMPSEEELRAKLTPMQYEVTRHAATEPPFRNEYWDEFRPGIYVDVATGEPLFVSTDKFESGCGWPAFSKPIDGTRLENVRDLSHGMNRIEVRAKGSDSHLGHVFNDGPRESGGLRYCINSAALRFVPLADMEREGYGKLIPLVKANR